jgi:hypothetical protein
VQTGVLNNMEPTARMLIYLSQVAALKFFLLQLILLLINFVDFEFRI